MRSNRFSTHWMSRMSQMQFLFLSIAATNDDYAPTNEKRALLLTSMFMSVKCGEEIRVERKSIISTRQTHWSSSLLVWLVCLRTNTECPEQNGKKHDRCKKKASWESSTGIVGRIHWTDLLRMKRRSVENLQLDDHYGSHRNIALSERCSFTFSIESPQRSSAKHWHDQNRVYGTRRSLQNRLADRQSR